MPDDPRSDADLIAAINAGDADAFASLYLRYRDRVARLAYRFTRHHDDALDVTQEAFAYFLRKFPGFLLTANLMTFFYPAVKNLSLTARKKRQRASGGEENLADLLAPPSSSNPSGLAEALTALTDAHREVILMRFVDGLSLEEIAAALDVPIGTVKSRLHHALQQLREDPRTRDYFS
jgi:RNA polymerase sigma-70 factor (ECF subfamily)